MKREAYPADASSLIYLATADVFEEIMRCVDEIGAPPGVWREAVEAGEAIGAAEVPRIRLAEEAGYVRRVALDDAQIARAATIAGQYRLGSGESEVLAVATPGSRAIVDEGRAARAAQSLGVVPVSTLFLPVLGHLRGELRADEAITLVRRLAVPTSARAEAVFVIEEHLSKNER